PMLRPRFSLRTLFVLVTIIGIGAGWVTHQLNWIRQRHAFIQAYELGLLCYSPPIPPPWHLRLFGEQGYEHQGLLIKEGYLNEARNLFPEIESIYELRNNAD